MALAALLTLDAMDAANARSWLKNGHKIFNATVQRLQAMAGLRNPKTAQRREEVKANRKKLAASFAGLGVKPK